MAAFVITKTALVVKPGIAKFVPFKTEHLEYPSEAVARETFELAYAYHMKTYGDLDINRDGDSFEAQLSPYTKTFVELTVIQ